MKVVWLTVLLLSVDGMVMRDERYLQNVQRSILELFSLSSFTDAPVLINLNCDLDPGFIKHLVATQLTVEIQRGPQNFAQLWLKIPVYAKVLSTGSGDDRFHLGLYCHSQQSDSEHGSGRTWEDEFPKIYRAIRPVQIPCHSFAMLWASDSETFWNKPQNRVVTSFTQIYATWNNRTSMLTLQTTKSARKKMFSRYLQLCLNFNPELHPLDLRDLKFGRTSVNRLEMGRVTIVDPTEPDGLRKTLVKLYDPEDSNISVRLKLADFPLRGYSNPKDFVWFSSYYDSVPVARIPSISKDGQIVRSILRAELWIPTILLAVTAATVLGRINEDLGETLYRLTLCLVHPVAFNSRAKPKQLLLIVGTWIFSIHLIKLTLQQDVLASMHGLPTERLRSIEQCTPSDDIESFDDTRGYILRGDLREFLRNELPPILRGAVICRNVWGFGPKKEALLSHIPMYRLDEGAETIKYARLWLLDAYMTDATDIPEFSVKSDHQDPAQRCCLRLAQWSLTNQLFRRTHLKQTSLNALDNLEVEMFDVLKLDIAPSYANKRCKIRGSDLYRCFRLEDLHPETGFAMRMSDVIPSLYICAAMILMSFTSVLLEMSVLAYWYRHLPYLI